VKSRHPQFIGSEDSKRRGENWQSRKRSALKRDGRICQLCGDKGTDVHHIIPKRIFKDKNRANNLVNLLTLCKPCHRKEDANFQKKERQLLQQSKTL
jgi:5-methylcytosine-specific restriction endonuclease McrA